MWPSISPPAVRTAAADALFTSRRYLAEAS